VMTGLERVLSSAARLLGIFPRWQAAAAMASTMRLQFAISGFPMFLSLGLSYRKKARISVSYWIMAESTEAFLKFVAAINAH